MSTDTKAKAVTGKSALADLPVVQGQYDGCNPMVLGPYTRWTAAVVITSEELAAVGTAARESAGGVLVEAAGDIKRGELGQTARAAAARLEEHRAQAEDLAARLKERRAAAETAVRSGRDRDADVADAEGDELARQLERLKARSGIIEQAAAEANRALAVEIAREQRGILHALIGESDRARQRAEKELAAAGAELATVATAGAELRRLLERVGK